MDEKAIQAIMAILKHGDRVEIVPVKDGVRIFRIKREEVKAKCANLNIQNPQKDIRKEL